MIAEPAAGLAVVVAVGVVCQLAAARWHVPSIILLLLAGLTVGPAMGLIDPDELFGDLLFPTVSAAVGLLLFEGGLNLRWREVGGLRVVLVRLLSIGVLTAATVGSLAAWAIGGLPLGPALLFGAIMVVTGPTVVIPLLRHARLRPEVASILRWEGIFVDSIGAVLAVVVFEVVVVDNDGQLSDVLAAITVTTLAGAAIGVTAAGALTLLLRDRRVPDHLENAVAFATVMAALAGANAVLDEAGLVATTVMGVTLASQRRVRIRGIAEFHESIAVLLVPMMFILLAARVTGSDLARNLLPAVGVVAALVLVGRPLSVLVSTIGSTVSPATRRYVAVMAPRGIVAASVSALFGLRLEEHGIAGGPDLAALTFLSIAGTVLIYGATAVPFARRLRIEAPDPAGIVLVGAPAWAADLGAALVDQGVPVLVIPCEEDDVEHAVSRGLLVYGGRLQSDDLDDAVHAIGARLALVVSQREEVSAFAADRLGRVVGQTNLFVVPADVEDHDARLRRPAEHWGRVAFGGHLTLADATTRTASGEAVSAVAGARHPDADDGTVLVRVSEAGIPSIVDGEEGDDEQPGGTLLVLGNRQPTSEGQPSSAGAGMHDNGQEGSSPTTGGVFQTRNSRGQSGIRASRKGRAFGMGITVSTLAIISGAVLLWAVETEFDGVNIDAAGVILLIVGIVGLVWSLLVAAAIGPFAARERVIEER